MNEAILSLGSNMGSRKENLNNAIKQLRSVDGIKIEAVSSFYETVPFETPDKQNKYINCCVKILTNLKPQELLEKCLQIETSMGRTRPYKFAPRTIDIDLLLYENEVINTPNLILPHPRMKNRPFVLAPLGEICDDLKFKSWDFREDFNQYKCNLEEFVQKIY